MIGYYPPASFHFLVVFLDILPSSASDVLFQSVSGLSASVETENLREGGENRFTHELPVRSQYSDLVLKRGAVPDSGVVRWCRDALEGFTFRPCDLLVSLLNDQHQPLLVWKIVHALPKRWAVSDLDAEKSAILIETLELSYSFFIVNPGSSA
jgi:phage tail-like protein